MGNKILTLSPGSTSTKVAVFDGTEALFRLNVTHPAEELARFDSAKDQFDYRRQTILDALSEQGIKLEDIDAFSGYCGAMGPTVGGIFAIDDTVCEHVMNAGVNHPAIPTAAAACPLPPTSTVAASTPTTCSRAPAPSRPTAPATCRPSPS